LRIKKGKNLYISNDNTIHGKIPKRGQKNYAKVALSHAEKIW
jgi:hypothetical protein